MIFLDSNIWLYGYVDEDARKRGRALQLFSRKDEVVLSTQVINEVTSNLLRKNVARERSVRELIEELYSDYVILEIGRTDMTTASELREEYRLSFWDGLIVATALRANADTLYSEDMQDGLVVRGRLTIRNPFR